MKPNIGIATFIGMWNLDDRSNVDSPVPNATSFFHFKNYTHTSSNKMD